MKKEKIMGDIAVRFWKGNERDQKAADIIQGVSAGIRNEFIKNAICRTAESSNDDQEPVIDTEVIRNIVKQEISLAAQDLEHSLLVSISNMLGQLEGKMQSGMIVVQNEKMNNDELKALAEPKEDEKQKEKKEVPKDCLDFCSSLIAGEVM